MDPSTSTVNRLFSRALYYMHLIYFAYNSPHVEWPKRVSYFFLSAPLYLLRIVEVAPFNLWLLLFNLIIIPKPERIKKF